MKGCQNSGRRGEYCQTGHNLYDPTRSSTAKNTQKQFEIQYEIGATSGNLYQDNFAFGDGANTLKLKRPVEFGGSLRTVDGDHGILGLGYVQEQGQGSSIFDEAVKQGLMDAPVVGFGGRSRGVREIWESCKNKFCIKIWREKMRLVHLNLLKSEA
jgi:hypothetical protein